MLNFWACGGVTRLKEQSYLHATYSGGSICVSGSSVQEDTYSGGSICESGLLVHRLQHRATYSGGSICECGLSVHSVTVVDWQATFTSTSTTVSCMVMALWLQSVTEWTDNGNSSVPLVCDCCGLTSHFHKYFHHSKLHGDGSMAAVCHRLKAQSYFHATYLSGSICKSGLSVHDNHRLKVQSYLHATYPGGSICECGLSVHSRGQGKLEGRSRLHYWSCNVSTPADRSTLRNTLPLSAHI